MNWRQKWVFYGLGFLLVTGLSIFVIDRTEERTIALAPESQNESVSATADHRELTTNADRINPGSTPRLPMVSARSSQEGRPGLDGEGAIGSGARTLNGAVSSSVPHAPIRGTRGIAPESIQELVSDCPIAPRGADLWQQSPCKLPDQQQSQMMAGRHGCRPKSRKICCKSLNAIISARSGQSAIPTPASSSFPHG